MEPITEADATVVEAQLGRTPRGMVGVAWRCPCGKPGVVATAPRLPDGTPFPTTFYLTCPRAVSGCSTLEAQGLMKEQNEILAEDPDLADAHRRAHEAYLAAREQVGEQAGTGPVPELNGISAGGMPDRVKCLHVLVAHSLAEGLGVNPLGDEARLELGEFWLRPCLDDE